MDESNGSDNFDVVSLNSDISCTTLSLCTSQLLSLDESDIHSRTDDTLQMESLDVNFIPFRHSSTSPTIDSPSPLTSSQPLTPSQFDDDCLVDQSNMSIRQTSPQSSPSQQVSQDQNENRNTRPNVPIPIQSSPSEALAFILQTKHLKDRDVQMSDASNKENIHSKRNLEDKPMIEMIEHEPNTLGSIAKVSRVKTIRSELNKEIATTYGTTLGSEACKEMTNNESSKEMSVKEMIPSESSQEMTNNESVAKVNAIEERMMIHSNTTTNEESMNRSPPEKKEEPFNAFLRFKFLLITTSKSLVNIIYTRLSKPIYENRVLLRDLTVAVVVGCVAYKLG